METDRRKHNPTISLNTLSINQTNLLVFFLDTDRRVDDDLRFKETTVVFVWQSLDNSDLGRAAAAEQRRSDRRRRRRRLLLLSTVVEEDCKEPTILLSDFSDIHKERVEWRRWAMVEASKSFHFF
jgi:hypothetical protein